jgi:hypothetical protein
VRLGGLGPDEVVVEAYHGRLYGDHAITGGSSVPLRCAADLGDGRFRFEGAIPASEAGEHAFGVRVLPQHAALAHRFATRLLAWH